MWATAILKMVSLSGFLARALQVGTISELSDVGGHLVPPPALYLAVVLPGEPL